MTVLYQYFSDLYVMMEMLSMGILNVRYCTDIAHVTLSLSPFGNKIAISRGDGRAALHTA